MNVKNKVEAIILPLTGKAFGHTRKVVVNSRTSNQNWKAKLQMDILQ